MNPSRNVDIAATENAVRQVYEFCPPTLVRYRDDGRTQYESQWRRFLEILGLPQKAFFGQTLLDVGCGSCEKASFYHDWGARVTGLDMTKSVLDHGRNVLGQRDVRLVVGSLFDSLPDETFDIVVADGVLHHTADTFAALKQCSKRVRPRGILMFGLINIWGSFWWFRFARIVVAILGGSDFHKRARWGQRLFARMRHGHEATSGSSFFRSPESWAYDWFGNPCWNQHSPSEVNRWLQKLGLIHRASIPSILEKENPRNRLSGLLRRVSRSGSAHMKWYWLANREPNMFYVVAEKSANQPDAVSR